MNKSFLVVEHYNEYGIYLCNQTRQEINNKAIYLVKFNMSSIVNFIFIRRIFFVVSADHHYWKSYNLLEGHIQRLLKKTYINKLTI